MAFATLDNLYQLKELNHSEILMLLSHVNQYFIVLKQMQPHQMKYVAQPFLFAQEIMKVQGKKDLDFITYTYLTSPVNMQWCTLKDQMTIVTVMDVKIFCLLCKAYTEDLLPTLEIDNIKILLDMSTYFIHEFGKMEQASYLSSQCAAALCHLLNKLDSAEDFDSIKDTYELTLKTVLNIPKVMLQKDVQ